jgi:hypothetical protein
VREFYCYPSLFIVASRAKSRAAFFAEVRSYSDP